MKISVMIPSKGRAGRCREAVRVLYSHTARPADLQIIVGIDAGQEADYGGVLDEGPEVKIAMVGPGNLPEKNNRLLGRASGDIIQCWADDLDILTAGWDDRIREAARKWPDGVWAGCMWQRHDNGQDAPTDCVTAVGRGWMEAVGGQIFDERFGHYYADSMVHAVADRIGRWVQIDRATFYHHGGKESWNSRIDVARHDQALWQRFGAEWADETAARIRGWLTTHERTQQ